MVLNIRIFSLGVFNQTAGTFWVPAVFWRFSRIVLLQFRVDLRQPNFDHVFSEPNLFDLRDAKDLL